MDVLESHPDVLQNIETAIVAAYDEDRTILDIDVLDALDALIRRYNAESERRTPARITLGPKAAVVYGQAEHLCEWRLGRQALDGAGETELEPLPLEVLVSCLKRVRKSVRFWNEKAGRQGYLEYVQQFVG